jgi:hypothetical protein
MILHTIYVTNPTFSPWTDTPDDSTIHIARLCSQYKSEEDFCEYSEPTAINIRLIQLQSICNVPGKVARHIRIGH